MGIESVDINHRLSEIQKLLKSPKENKNDFGKYNYRNTEDILNAVKQHLSEDEYILLDGDVVMIGDRFYVKSVAKFVKANNHIQVTAFAREEEVKKGMDGSQITGSATSYSRKYALAGLFAIDNEKDADSMDNKNAQHKININSLKSKSFDEYKQEMQNCNNIDELKSIFNEIVKNKDRFNEDQTKELTNIKEVMKNELTKQ
jgi:hypothetical protein